MLKLSNDTLLLCEEITNELANNSLPPQFAKLYSQYSRIQANQRGLTSWTESEFSKRVNDAIILIQSAFIQKENGKEWKQAFKRAGEIFEWLGHPNINTNNLPLYLLSAALYQFAGYPARSLGLLNKYNQDNSESKLLRLFLKADFNGILKLISNYYQENPTFKNEIMDSSNYETENFFQNINRLIVNETISIFGILAAQMRWGDEDRIENAITKFSSIEKILLGGEDRYSWLLARLCYENTHVYLDSSLRNHILRLYDTLNIDGQKALELYYRNNFVGRKSLAWTSQIIGIDYLSKNECFLLCTPTGSGKTRIAELAILQSLFQKNDDLDDKTIDNPIVLYIVPSRALAAEVEYKLSEVLNKIDKDIFITSLYGGQDFGPSDLILNIQNKTVLISTQEKADALIRLLGIDFLKRVNLVIIDEAHNIEFNSKKTGNSLIKSESREFRLESLITRLLTILNSNTRFIGLSAVAVGIENSLAKFICSDINANPVNASYRSTRQLIGRLICQPNRKYEIEYDLLDNSNLTFKEGRKSNKPYIENPLSPYPKLPEWESIEKNRKADNKLKPYLYWAALKFASQEENGKRKCVLVSLTELANYAKELLEFINIHWKDVELPSFFVEPTKLSKIKIWKDCLNSCADYFGKESVEYQLLAKGIIVHHGKMPGSMGRLLIKLVDKGVINLVLATSTLTEGVNLPFEIILIPKLTRSGFTVLDKREFSNLIGRAGRPGYSTEGQSLVLLEPRPDWIPPDKFAELPREEQTYRINISNKYKNYSKLIKSLEYSSNTGTDSIKNESAIENLILLLQKKWIEISKSDKPDNFIDWLEKTAPLVEENLNESEQSLIETLDSFDYFLITTIEELNMLDESDIDLEEKLIGIWRKTYAYYVSENKNDLETIFVARAQAITNTIYPDPAVRKRLYKSGLPPMVSIQLQELFDNLKEKLEESINYVQWTNKEKQEFIADIIEQFQSIPKFKITGDYQNKWKDILGWWLNPEYNCKKIKNIDPSNRYEFVHKHLYYKFNWGLGSLISIAFDDIKEDQLNMFNLESWKKTGLPWVVFWLKELIIWGTLDPVVAYLMARDKTISTRQDAKLKAQEYYNQNDDLGDELYNPTYIKRWLDMQEFFESIFDDVTPKKRKISSKKVELLRDFNKTDKFEYRVLPVEINQEMYWFDPAGYPLAKCPQSNDIIVNIKNYDYILNIKARKVSWKNYISS